MIKSFFKKRPVRLKGQALYDLYIRAYERDNYRCQAPDCRGRSVLDRAPHHIQYKSQGGGDEIDNLVTLCMDCHDRIHNRGTLKIMAYGHGEKRKVKWSYGETVVWTY